MPSIHMRCSKTASLRATATTALRRPLVRINRIPQDLICEPAIVRMSRALAAAYNAARTSRSPAFDMRPGLSCSPDWYLRGVSPKWTPTVRDRLKHLRLHFSGFWCSRPNQRQRASADLADFCREGPLRPLCGITLSSEQTSLSCQKNL